MSIRATVERASAARRHGPLAMIVVMVVMGASAVGFWSLWRALGHHGARGDVPVIAADRRPLKVLPADPGGMPVPDQNIAILNGKRGTEPRVEQLLPPPETPLPRPAPPEPALNDAPAVAPIAAPAAAVPEPRAPVAVPAVEPASPPVVAALTQPPAPAPPAPATAPPTASAAAYRIQVGAVRSEEAAQHEWARLKRLQPDLLDGLDMNASRTDQGERGVFYRIVAGPIADAAKAQRTCEELKQRKVGCILVKP